jgi:hypothetical protein
MGSIQSFHDERQGDTILDEVEGCLRQEECPDDIYYVQCFHCDFRFDPHSQPVYCWNLGVDNQHMNGGIFVCAECDAEHRTRYISLEEERNAPQMV